MDQRNDTGSPSAEKVTPALDAPKHPFVPGARVAIHERYSDGVTEGFVEKNYKSGTFTLRGSKQQWRPWSGYGDNRWSATETGSGWMRRRLDLWDETTTDKELYARLEAKAARSRWRYIRDKMNAIKEPTIALCDAIDAALSAAKGET